MSKKICRLAISTIILLFAMAIPAFAKEMTVDDIGNELEKIEQKDNTRIGSYYIIGEHIFTSNYIIDTRDIMLAARSINMKNEYQGEKGKVKDSLKEMTVHSVIRKYDTKFQPTGWEILSNYVGETTLTEETKLSIHYIDYEYVFETLDTDTLLENKKSEILSNNKYTVTFDEKSKKMTFKVLDRNANISKDEIAKIISEILKTQYVQSVKIGNTTISKNEDEESIWNKIKTELKTVSGKEDDNIKLGDLIGKNTNLTIELDGKVAHSQNDNTSESYTVEFLYNSVATLNKEIPEKDIKDLESQNNYYVDEENDEYTVLGQDGEYTISGKIIEREKIKGFGGEKNGFYVPFVISLNSEINPKSVKVKLPKSDSEYNEADNNDGNLFTNGKLTVLFEIEEKERVKTRDIIVIVNNVETKIRIDFTNLKLMKTSKFAVEALPKEKKTEFKVDEKGSWYDEEHGYNVTVNPVENEENKYEITGLLPIFNDEGEDWKDNDNVFESENELYYLGLLLKFINAPEDYQKDTSNITVEFGNEDKLFMKVDGDDFKSNKELYILKALEETSEEKSFTITVDLDGKKSGAEDKYAPHTVTVDWSKLEFQKESTGSEYEIATKTGILETDKNTLENDWEFKFDLNDISVENDETKTLKGTVREQTLAEAAKFQNPKGYFVPIKIEFPKDNPNYSAYKEKWQIILKTEAGPEKTVTPSHEDYTNGYTIVLFRVEKDAHEITYKIDYDGGENNFVPKEVKIPISFTFETENKITYNYNDGTGKIVTVDEVVYQGEEITLKDLTDIETDYREFAGWYKDGSTKVEDGTTTEEDQDLTLTAHWNLNAEKFAEDIVADINAKDFSEEFTLKQNNNEITINVNKPNVELAELSKTSIPGAIAYVLEKREVKGISLTVGGQTKTFSKDESEQLESIKSKVINGAKEAFDEDLNKHETEATLDGLEYKDKTFKLKIDTVDDQTVKLVKNDGTEISNDEDKTYTFKFDSDLVVVDQDDTTELNEKSIDTAISSSKNYSKIYIDGDYTTNGTLTINATNAISIMPVGDGTGTISVTGEPKETAVDVKSGTVTMSNLKLTGGTKSELKVEGEETTVTVDNVDVSGITELGEFDKDQTEFPAGIIVTENGTLNVISLVNNDEKYDYPTIRIPLETVKPNEKRVYPGTVNLKGSEMTAREGYRKIKRERGKYDEMAAVLDKCYYIENNNSILSVIMFKDELAKDSGSVFLIYKHYYYGEHIDTSEISEYRESILDKNKDKESLLKEYEFKGWFTQYYELGKAPETGGITDFSKVELVSGTTYYAGYAKKPVANVILQNSASGMRAEGNNISGTIKTQTNGKFVIPVALTSERFQENVTTVKVTDPNGEVENYKYSSATENGIAPASTTQTMKLDLEAIKTNKITGSNGKEYKITVDVDGSGKEEPETYTVNYEGVKTAEEIINAAAQNTQDATSLTITKDNKIKGGTEKYKFEIDRTNKLKLYTEGDGESKKEQYSFPRESVEAGVETKEFVVVEKSKEISQTDRPKLNDWTYFNQFDALSEGTHELGLLKDVIKKDESGKIDGEKSIYALTTIEKEADHKYKVVVSEKKLGSWLNLAYIDHKNEETTMGTIDESKTVTLEITLDENDQYITGLKTLADFSITKDDGKYTDNRINVTFSKIGSTTVKTPQQMLGNSETENATNEQIRKFIKDGRDWWNKYTNTSPAGK